MQPLPVLSDTACVIMPLHNPSLTPRLQEAQGCCHWEHCPGPFDEESPLKYCLTHWAQLLLVIELFSQSLLKNFQNDV